MDISPENRAKFKADVDSVLKAINDREAGKDTAFLIYKPLFDLQDKWPDNNDTFEAWELTIQEQKHAARQVISNLELVVSAFEEVSKAPGLEQTAAQAEVVRQTVKLFIGQLQQIVDK
jgi:hypothetical protein